MEFVQTGTFNENYLKKKIGFKLLEGIQNMLLDKLNYLIGFISEEKSEITTKYVENLAKKFQGFAKEDFWENASPEVKKLYSDFQNLNQFPNLKSTSFNYLIHLLQWMDQINWEKKEVEISTRGLIQAWIYPTYYFIDTLAETINRSEAVKLFKRYITSYHYAHPSPHRDKFVNLENRFEERTTGDTTSSEWVIVHTMLEDGKYAFKNKNCPTCFDASKDLPDVEFKYLAFCYGDYAAFRANTNDHIILTMEHTLIQGDPYCSRVLHDTRFDFDLRHPPKEFWDNFEPGNEKEAMKYYNKQ